MQSIKLKIVVLKCLSGVWGFYILEIFGLQYILSAENFIFKDFFVVKVNGSDVNPEICTRVFI